MSTLDLYATTRSSNNQTPRCLRCIPTLYNQHSFVSLLTTPTMLERTIKNTKHVPTIDIVLRYQAASPIFSSA